MFVSLCVLFRDGQRTRFACRPFFLCSWLSRRCYSAAMQMREYSMEHIPFHSDKLYAQIPSHSCWPNQTEWHALNASISGQLIADTPVAASCYPGPLQNVAACEEVDDLWTNTTFQQNSPIGYSYPLYVPCPPVNASAGQQPGNCSLGNAPVYTVNATNTEQVAAGIAFAERNNIRLVIRDTGHDLLGAQTASQQYRDRSLTYVCRF